LSKTNGKLEQIASSKGLTFGELYDKADEIYKRDGLCPICENSQSTAASVDFTETTPHALDMERVWGGLSNGETP
jgi:hypothetical protein